MKEAATRTTICLALIATTLIGCKSVAPTEEPSKINTASSIFNPLRLPQGPTDPEPFLDPLVFNSDQAYRIRAVHSATKACISNGSSKANVPTDKNTKSHCAALAPATDAAFVGGSEQLVAYLKENILAYLPVGIGWLKQPTIGFTINKQGVAEDVQLLETSGNAELDEMLVEFIGDMSRWKPALTADGKTQRQGFEFSVIQAGC